MLKKLKNDNDIQEFHQQTGDCREGCIYQIKYKTMTTQIDGGVYVDEDKDKLTIHLQGSKEIELIFKRVEYIHWDMTVCDGIIYGLSLFFHDGKLYFSDSEELDPKYLLWRGALIVVAQEGYWRFCE